MKFILPPHTHSLKHIISVLISYTVNCREYVRLTEKLMGEYGRLECGHYKISSFPWNQWLKKTMKTYIMISFCMQIWRQVRASCAIFWVITPGSSEKDRFFRKKKHIGKLPPASTSLLLGMLFHPDDGGDMFFRTTQRLNTRHRILHHKSLPSHRQEHLQPPSYPLSHAMLFISTHKGNHLIGCENYFWNRFSSPYSTVLIP